MYYLYSTMSKRNCVRIRTGIYILFLCIVKTKRVDAQGKRWNHCWYFEKKMKRVFYSFLKQFQGECPTLRCWQIYIILISYHFTFQSQNVLVIYCFSVYINSNKSSWTFAMKLCADVGGKPVSNLSNLLVGSFSDIWSGEYIEESSDRGTCVNN